MTNHKKYIVTYKSFATPKQVLVGNRETILTYDSGTINVEMEIKGHQNHLLDVLCQRMDEICFQSVKILDKVSTLG